MLKKNDKSLKNQMEKIQVPKRKRILIAVGAVLLLFIIFIVISPGGSPDYVSIVKNGYLGEYTDVTVSELLVPLIEVAVLISTVEFTYPLSSGEDLNILILSK